MNSRKSTFLLVVTTVIFLSFILSGCFGTALDLITNLVENQSSEEDSLNAGKSGVTNDNYGNTPANIMNIGLVAKQGDWIYYSNISEDGKLYKIHTDETDPPIMLIDDQSSFINVLGDWIYYSNADDGYRLYKIRTDGTERTKLNDDISVFVNVIGEWIYYAKAYSVNSEGGELYKIRTDGTGREKLNDDLMEFFNVVDNWIYYKNISDEGLLYKIRTDGTDRTKLNANDDSILLFNVTDDWIYYVNEDSEQLNLYKIRTDGTGLTKLTDDKVGFINVQGDWIYYSNISDDNKLYKMRTDGTGSVKLSDNAILLVNVFGEFIYYVNVSDDKTYKIRTDGTGHSVIGQTESGGTLIVGESSLNGVFNPVLYSDVYDGYVVGLVFEGLVTNDQSGEIVPALAEDWSISWNKLTYTFTIAEDAKFSNGNPVTAEDVKFTYETVAHPEYDGARYYWVSDLVGVKEFTAGEADSIAGIEVIDKRTISFTITEPNVSKIWDFTVGILCREYYAFDSWNEFKSKNIEPMGAGPFVFVEYLPDQYALFERNANYYKGAAQLEGVIIRIVPEETKIAAVNAGDIHMAQTTACIDSYNAIQNSRNASVFRYIGNGYNVIGMDLTSPYFEDVKVRQALAYGLDRKQFIENEYGGLAEVCHTPISPLSWAFPGIDEMNKYEYNPEKAAQLLDEAGWLIGNDGYRYKDGVKFSFTWTIYTEVAWPQNLLALATDQWGQLGIEVKNELLDFNSVVTKVFDEHDFEMFNIGWSLAIDPDPTGLFGEAAKTPGGFNPMQYSNERAWEIFRLARQEYDQESRAELLKEWAVIANEELPYIFMAIREEIWAVNDAVDGLDIGPYYNWVQNIMDITVASD